MLSTICDGSQRLHMNQTTIGETRSKFLQEKRGEPKRVSDVMRTESPWQLRRAVTTLGGCWVPSGSCDMDNISSAIGQVFRELMARLLVQPLPLMIRLQMLPLVEISEHSDVEQIQHSIRRPTSPVSVCKVERSIEANMIVKLAVVVILGFALGVLWKKRA